MVDRNTDDSWPCSSASGVPCSAEFNSMRVDVGEFEADTVVFWENTGEGPSALNLVFE